MLARREALERAGGIDVIRGEIIDDCALGRALKAQGPIWLGLTERASSIRPYNGMAEIRAMVARSAYAQLGYSPLALLGTFVGMIAVYGAAPVLALFATQSAQASGIMAWIAMAFSFQPILKFYRVSPLWGLALPDRFRLCAVHARLGDPALRGCGGMWKGRAQAMGQKMTAAADLPRARATRREFPVASILIDKRVPDGVLPLRPADDVADHPAPPAAESSPCRTDARQRRARRVAGRRRSAPRSPSGPTNRQRSICLKPSAATSPSCVCHWDG